MPKQVSSKNTLNWVLPAICGLPVLIFLFFAAIRLFYPLELEVLEGGIFVWLTQAFRSGVVFPPPNPDYIPFLYPGLFIYLALGISHLLGGPGFIALRLISIISTLITAYIVGHNLKPNPKPGEILVGVGIYLSIYFPLYTWFDVGRIDMMAACLGAIGTSLIWRTDDYRKWLLGGMTLGLSFATKQVFLALLVPAIIYGLVRGKRQIIAILVGFLLGGVLPYLIIDWLNHGNSWLYIYEIPAHLYFGTDIIKLFVLLKHVAMMAPLFLLAIWQVFSEIKLFHRGWLKRLVNDLWTMAFISGLLFGVILIMQAGAAANTLLIFAPTMAVQAARWVISADFRSKPILKVVIIGISILYCAVSDGWIGAKLPPQSRVIYYNNLTSFLSEEKRPYVPEFPDLTILAKTSPTADYLALADLRRVSREVDNEFRRREEEGYYSVVITGIGGGKGFWLSNGRYKEIGQDILEDLSVSNDFGNYPIKPIAILIPNERDEAAVIARLKKHHLIPQ